MPYLGELSGAQIDREITGNYGEDQFRGYDESTCTVCGQEMDDGAGCTVAYVICERGASHDDDEIARRIPFADTETAYCGDCNVGQGQRHHFGCARERCPFCDGQLMACACNAVEHHSDE